MKNYQLELRQIVDYPRCRIYREFIQTLIETEAFAQADAPVFFIIPFFGPMSTSGPLTDA